MSQRVPYRVILDPAGFVCFSFATYADKQRFAESCLPEGWRSVESANKEPTMLTFELRTLPAIMVLAPDAGGVYQRDERRNGLRRLLPVALGGSRS